MKNETKERIIAGVKLLCFFALPTGLGIVIFQPSPPSPDILTLPTAIGGLLVVVSGIAWIYVTEAKFSFRNLENEEENNICPDCVDEIIDGKCWCADKRIRG